MSKKNTPKKKRSPYTKARKRPKFRYSLDLETVGGMGKGMVYFGSPGVGKTSLMPRLNIRERYRLDSPHTRGHHHVWTAEQQASAEHSEFGLGFLGGGMDFFDVDGAVSRFDSTMNKMRMVLKLRRDAKHERDTYLELVQDVTGEEFSCDEKIEEEREEHIVIDGHHRMDLIEAYHETYNALENYNQNIRVMRDWSFPVREHSVEVALGQQREQRQVRPILVIPHHSYKVSHLNQHERDSLMYAQKSSHSEVTQTYVRMLMEKNRDTK